MRPTPSDRHYLHQQLGRIPRGLHGIETRCSTGHPQTISVYPLIHTDDAREPFPTTFWLTCPRLIHQIAQLEHIGLIPILERTLATSPRLRANLHANHRAYIAERWSLLTQSDRAWIRTHGWQTTYLQRGIGGIANWNHLKCLHLHVAHHQARFNVIGRYLLQHHSLACD